MEHTVPQTKTKQLADSPPLFETRFLDFFSRIHPAVPAIIFVPVIAAMVWLGADGGLAPLSLVLLVAAGLLLWTLTEYWLHRLLFHWEPTFKYGDRLHFIIHGVHHDHPNDRMRLQCKLKRPKRSGCPRRIGIGEVVDEERRVEVEPHAAASRHLGPE